MTNLIGSILVSSIRNLFDRQPDILTHTSATGMTEWNLGHHLANEIVRYIFWLNHDLDVMKRNYSNRRPDIIFHRRGINALNFLVVEIKINNYVDEDIRKIKDDWMGAELNYRYGASVVVQSIDNFEVRLFERGMAEPKYFGLQAQQIPSPATNQEIALRFNSLVRQIEKSEIILVKSKGPADYSKEPNIQQNVNETEGLIYALYGQLEKP
ncbi:MAG: hypothetical protein PHF56_14800 [Desulfuromonadaceae bacterium]|nr:hypothetical protein [Desulfuromonadaceae bacterium]